VIVELIRLALFAATIQASGVAIHHLTAVITGAFIFDYPTMSRAPDNTRAIFTAAPVECLGITRLSSSRDTSRCADLRLEAGLTILSAVDGAVSRVITEPTQLAPDDHLPSTKVAALLGCRFALLCIAWVSLALRCIQRTVRTALQFPRFVSQL
jgi:hypothetical protein